MNQQSLVQAKTKAGPTYANNQHGVELRNKVKTSVESIYFLSK